MKRKDGPLAPRARWLLAAGEITASLAVAALAIGLLADVASGTPYAAVRWELIAVVGLLLLQLVATLAVLLSVRSSGAIGGPFVPVDEPIRLPAGTRTPARRVALSAVMSVAVVTLTLVPSGVVTSPTVLALDPAPTAALTPVITWADPADIVAGTPLSSVQLDATADIPGEFSYSPPAGAVLDVGDHQALSVVFTPTDTASYATAEGTVYINVTAAIPDPTPAPTEPPTPEPTPAPTEPPAPAPTDSWTPAPTEASTPAPTDPWTPAPTEAPTPEPTPEPTPQPTPTPPGEVTVDQTSSAPRVGRHRVDPGSALSLAIAVTAATTVTDGTLVETVPSGWTVTYLDGGSYDPAAGTITWSLGSIAAGRSVAREIGLIAPSLPTPDGGYAVPATFTARCDQAYGLGTVSTYAPDEDVLVAPLVAIPHSSLAQLSGSPAQPLHEPLDAPILDEQRFETFRVRFDVRNPDTVPVTWTPQLEYQVAFGGAWAAVPSDVREPGVAFYVTGEWVAAPGGGTMPGPGGEVIDATSLGAGDRAAGDLTPADGYHSMSANPIPAFRLPGSSRSAVEFSVRTTVDAAYLTAYEFRVTDASSTFAGAVQPWIRLGSQPIVELSPGQRTGDLADDPVAQALRLGPPAPAYALVAPGMAGSAAGPAADPVHGPYLTLTSDACGACHRAHSASGANLLPQPSPQFGLCVTCHAGGTAGAADIASRYATAPTNDPATRSYYQHDPTQVAGHTSAETDVFAGVSARHAECADCHQPHRAAASPDASPGPDGYAVSGRLQGATGVSVTNGAAGEAPTYALVSSITTEYQLCFKCHSGYTVLPDNTGLPPSQAELDKGVEFNPANLSYHPVEAPGTNQTTQMDASLAGTSPYKLWTFTATSTIRCLNCHADSSALPPAGASPSPAPPSDGSSLPVHTSQNRGILIQNYRDRVLKGPIDAYDPNDFALCFSCHAEAPFRDTSGSVRDDTNFRYHGFHVSDILDKGTTGTSIDTAGDGGGLAICSECHFRIHSTTYAVNGQPPGERLVNFAPNVTAATGLTLNWIRKTPVQDGSCTLKCHSAGHRPENY